MSKEEDKVSTVDVLKYIIENPNASKVDIIGSARFKKLLLKIELIYSIGMKF